MSLISTHEVLNKRTGRGFFHGHKLVSGGLLAREDEIVVDDYRNPSSIYGVGNGAGDFMRNPKNEMINELILLEKLLKESVKK